MINSFLHRDVIAISDFSKEKILNVLKLAKELKKSPPISILQGSILGSCFFEPSTRTRLSLNLRCTG